MDADRKAEVLEDASAAAVYFFALKRKGVPNDIAAELTEKYIMARLTRDLYAELLNAKLVDEDAEPWEK